MNRLLIISGSDGLLGKSLIAAASLRDISFIPLTRRRSSNQALRYVDDLIDITNLLPEQKAKLLDSEVSKTIVNCAWSGGTKLTNGGIASQFRNLKFIEALLHFCENYSIKNFFNIGTMDELIIERMCESNDSISSNFSHVEYGLAKCAARDLLKFLCYLKKIDLVHARISLIIDKSLQRNNFIDHNLRSALVEKIYTQPTSDELYNISTSDFVAHQILDNIEADNRSDILLGGSLVMPLLPFFESISRPDYISNIKISDLKGSILQLEDFGVVNYSDYTYQSTIKKSLSDLLREISNE